MKIIALVCIILGFSVAIAALVKTLLALMKYGIMETRGFVIFLFYFILPGIAVMAYCEKQEWLLILVLMAELSGVVPAAIAILLDKLL